MVPCPSEGLLLAYEPLLADSCLLTDPCLRTPACLRTLACLLAGLATIKEILPTGKPLPVGKPLPAGKPLLAGKPFQLESPYPLRGPAICALFSCARCKNAAYRVPAALAASTSAIASAGEYAQVPSPTLRTSTVSPAWTCPPWSTTPKMPSRGKMQSPAR